MKTQTRSLLATDRGITLAPSASSKGEKLCDYCAASPFCALKDKVRVCKGYVAPVTFRRPFIGLDGFFSTFRLGHAWPQRLKAVGHKTVALVDAHKNEVFGHARVVDVQYGTIEEMIEQHGWSNHLIIGEGVSDDQAPARLMEIVRQIFGPHMMKPGKNACTIFLDRVQKRT